MAKYTTYFRVIKTSKFQKRPKFQLILTTKNLDYDATLEQAIKHPDLYCGVDPTEKGHIIIFLRGAPGWKIMISRLGTIQIFGEELSQYPTDPRQMLLLKDLLYALKTETLVPLPGKEHKLEMKLSYHAWTLEYKT